MTSLLSQIGRTWCRAMHRKPLWPMHGEYECPVCMRRYPVPWADSVSSQSPRPVEPLRSSGMVVQHAQS